MKAVRKFVPMIVLLLVLTLLLGPAAAAGRPPKGEAKDVVFSGDIEGQGELIVESQRNGVTVYGPNQGRITLTFSGDMWEGFEGPQTGRFRITLKNGDATMYFDFDWYYNEDVQANVPLRHLEGFGSYGLEGQPYEITLDETVIYKVEPRRSGKKGGFGFKFTEPAALSGDVDFDMMIGD